MIKKIFLIVGLIISIVFISSCYEDLENDNIVNNETEKIEVDPNKMLNFTCETNKGYEFELYKRSESKPAFINFWATWCGPCVMEMPELQEVYDIYKDKVDFIFINCGDTKDIIDSFLNIKDNDFSFPIGFDEKDELAEKFNITGIPTTFIVDKNNNISDIVVGARNGSTYKSLIEKVLNV